MTHFMLTLRGINDAATLADVLREAASRIATRNPLGSVDFVWHAGAIVGEWSMEEEAENGND